MTRTEHLLVILMEECNEVAQRASKALRFGLGEVQPGQPHTNAERVTKEMSDLYAVFTMLAWENSVPPIQFADMLAKREKVGKFLGYSGACGTVDGEQADPSYPHPEAK